MKIGAFEFFSNDENTPWLPMNLWVVDGLGDSWKLQTTKPDSDAPQLDVSDLKEWFLDTPQSNERTFKGIKKNILLGAVDNSH